MAMKDIVTEYNRLTGKNIKRFASLADGERRLALARLQHTEVVATKKRGPKGFTHAIALSTGRSVLQENSTRGAVFAAVARHNDYVAVDELDSIIGRNTRPFLLKLRAMGHIKLETRG